MGNANSGSLFTANGGGIYCGGSDQTVIQQNTISGNHAQGYTGQPIDSGSFHSGGNANGGGIYIDNSTTTIINNVISFNTAQGGGGYSQNGGYSGNGFSGGTGDGGAYIRSSARPLLSIILFTGTRP